MARANVNDILAFLAVAKEHSFTRAAAQLGVSPSALSHTIRGLETRLGLRLLARTTRSVAPTEAGERLLQTVGPRFDEIESELAALSELREKPAGTIRITAAEHPAIAILEPALTRLLPEYPDINVEIIVDYGLTDIVAERYDAGVRLGEQVAKDMVAVRIGPDMRMAVVGSPSYFAKRGKPVTPQDLTTHACINIRLPIQGRLRLEVCEGRAGAEGSGRRPGRLQQHRAQDEHGLVGAGAGLLAGRSGQSPSCGWAAPPGAGGLVPPCPGLPPLLSEPAATCASLRARR